MKKGMIKVSVFYPSGEDKTFDMDYYCNKHVPMVAGLLGDAVKGATVEKGLGATNDPAVYVAMGNLYFDSFESFEQAYGANAAKIVEDIPNYTNITPVIQVSEVQM
jgi:uncharacterized protein (TIGR02118 family)